MTVKLTVTNIVQAQRGTVQLRETDKDGKPVENGVTVAIQFKTAKETAALQHGTEYTVSFTPVKK